MRITTTTVGCHVPPSPRHYINKKANDLWIKSNDRFKSSPIEDLLTWKITADESNGNKKFSIVEKLYNVAKCIKIQEALGMDIIAEGELGREVYYAYFQQHIVEQYQTERTFKITHHQTAIDYELARQFTDRPLKITLPGPVTLAQKYSISNKNPVAIDQLAHSLAFCVRSEIAALYKAGCRHIQIDEPLFSTLPDYALAFGFDLLDYCYGGYKDLTKYLHICRNYPNSIDGVATNKAKAECYEPLANQLNTCCADIISLEDAAIKVTNSVLQTIKDKKIMLGVCSVGTRTTESVASIVNRVKEVVRLRSNDELYLSPDCGFRFLDFETAVGKMRAINEAKLVLSN